jgi:signal transduction histidine kinase
MPSNDPFPEIPSQPHASVLRDQLEANERLVLAALRAQEEAEDARSGRILAEDESDGLRVTAAELVATAEFRERLLGIIGHDLRNPLNTIVVAAQLLAEGGGLQKRDVGLASRIVDSGRRMGRMIDQLANFTRARLGGGFELDLAQCDLAAICRNVVEESRLSSGAQISFDTVGDLVGRWDADRLAEVLSNLIGNAADHAASGTPVLVRAHDEGSWIVTQIQNEGVCIPPELVPTIFDAFRRARKDARRDSGHLGLGLYISREIALSHGGSLAVKSANGETTFSLRLPRLPKV